MPKNATQKLKPKRVENPAFSSSDMVAKLAAELESRTSWSVLWEEIPEDAAGVRSVQHGGSMFHSRRDFSVLSTVLSRRLYEAIIPQNRALRFVPGDQTIKGFKFNLELEPKIRRWKLSIKPRGKKSLVVDEFFARALDEELTAPPAHVESYRFASGESRGGGTAWGEFDDNGYYLWFPDFVMNDINGMLVRSDYYDRDRKDVPEAFLSFCAMYYKTHKGKERAWLGGKTSYEHLDRDGVLLPDYIEALIRDVPKLNPEIRAVKMSGIGLTSQQRYDDEVGTLWFLRNKV